jgi:Predicted transcriptional regulators
MTPFGQKLEQLRRSRGLQQAQLAAEAGVQSCYISAMENGRKGPPSLRVFNKLSQVLDLTEVEKRDLWLTGLQSKKTRKVPPETSTSEYVLVDELWARLGSLTENQINLISLALKTATSDGGRRYREI